MQNIPANVFAERLWQSDLTNGGVYLSSNVSEKCEKIGIFTCQKIWLRN